jgi:LCP family protein required for cell wall assembly
VPAPGDEHGRENRRRGDIRVTDGEGEDDTGVEGPRDEPSAEDAAKDPAWIDETPDETEARRRRHHERREEHKRKVKQRRRRKRIAIVSAVSFATLLVLGVVWFWWTFGGLERIPDSVGQAGADTPGTTILLVGSDPAQAETARDSEVGWRQDLERSDLVMLLHMTEDHRALFVVSIPADGVVPIPGVGPGKLSDAAVAGGPRLVARTVEELTGVRLDRFAVLDLNAFREIVDVLDGVVVEVPHEACGLPAGARRFDGQAALDYIALQGCMPRQDLDRVERQQSLVKGLMKGAVDGGKITHPFAVNRMLRATASHLAVEDGFSYPSMFGTLWSMRHLRTGNTTFLTVPVAAKPLVTQDGVDYVILDEARDQELWAALREDRMREYVALHTDAAVLGR